MSLRRDRIEQLRRQFVNGMCRDLRCSEDLAMPFANAALDVMLDIYGGSRLSVPKPTRELRAERIQRELSRGDDLATICERHAISRRTLNRLFPGGLPRAANDDAKAA